MRYDNYYRYRDTVDDPAFRRRLALRTIGAEIRAIPERIRARHVPLAPVAPPRLLAREDVPLILVTRDGAHLLRSFIRHYRGLGVTRFIIVDDRSSDETRDVLTDHADVDLWASSVRYGEAKMGIWWRERLARTYGRGRWYVNVDIDEFLVYDGMDRHPLPDLFRWLERKRLKRLLAPMLDLYPPGRLSEAMLAPDRAPWDVASHFDAAGYAIEAGRRTTRLFGGPRVRLFGVRAQMTKFPVLYWDRRTFFCAGIHSPFPYNRNFGPIAGALLHFKYFADFRDRVEAAVADRQRWHGAAQYQAYDDRLRGAPDLVMAADVSTPYAGVDDLVGRGFVASIDWTGHGPTSADRPLGAPAATSPAASGARGAGAMKYFVVSLHRCGTHSTASYLENLGIRTRHWPVDHEGVDLQEMVRGRETDLAHVADVLAPVIDSYQAVADVPIPALYRELFSRYPEAKFLLLYRDAVDWVQSVRWKLRRGDFQPYVRTLYWAYFPRRPQRIHELSDAELVWMHGQHVAEVTAFFREVAPDKLGVFDLYAPDTGPRLAAFLGAPSTRPFPHLLPRRRDDKPAPGTR